MKRRARIRDSVWLMVFVALALRLIVVSFDYQGRLKLSRDNFHFGYETGRIAESIASGHGFSNPLYGDTGPTALLTPVYPYILAGLFKLFGMYTKASAVAILSVNSLFSALTCVPIFFMARESFGGGAAALAGWMWVFFPQAVYLSADRVGEGSLAALLLSLLVLLTPCLETAPGLVAWTGFGLLFGLAALTNPALLSVFLFLLGWACYRLRKKGGKWAYKAAVATLGVALIIVPWQLRNYYAFHEFIPLRDGFWLEVHLGNTGDTSSYWAPWAHPSANEGEMAEYRRVGEITYISEKRGQALQFIRAHPSAFVSTSLRRFVFVWTGVWGLPKSFSPAAMLDFDPEDLRTNLGNAVVYTAFTVLAVAGLIRGFRERNGETQPYLLALLIFPLVYYVTHPDPRYRHPIDPEVVVLSAYAITGWFAAPNTKDQA